MINISRLYCGIENSSDSIRYHYNNDKGPIVVYNCTNKCERNCLHCYSKNNFSAGSELDTKQAKNLLKQLAEIKCPVVLFSGGEPLERKDLFEILDFARSLSLSTVLSTNGNLINFDVAEKLADSGVKYVGISIDGIEKTHDNFRGVKGGFVAAVNAVKFCKDVNLKVGLRFTITNRNFNQIKDIFSLAGKLNVQRICFYHLISAGNAAKNNLKCTDQQIRQALNDICDCAQDYAARGVIEVLTVGNHADGPFILNRLKQESSPLYEKSFDLLQKFGGNKIGAKIFAIDPAGNVHPDQFWQDFSLGNIAESNLEYILNNFLNIFKNKISFAPKRCKKCKWLNLCGTNARFNGDYKSEGFLEPACFLDEQEISIVEKSNGKFTCQNAQA